jgi:hypothetical protein
MLLAIVIASSSIIIIMKPKYVYLFCLPPSFSVPVYGYHPRPFCHAITGGEYLVMIRIPPEWVYQFGLDVTSNKIM